MEFLPILQRGRSSKQSASYLSLSWMGGRDYLCSATLWTCLTLTRGTSLSSNTSVYTSPSSKFYSKKETEEDSMNHMAIYVSGPMSNMPENGHPPFHKASAHLRKLGYTVISPAEMEKIHPTPLEWQEYMRHDLAILTQFYPRIERIVLLEGWSSSKGAQIEAFIGHTLGIPLYLFNEYSSEGMLPLPTVHFLLEVSGAKNPSSTENFSIEKFSKDYEETYKKIFSPLLEETENSLNAFLKKDDQGETIQEKVKREIVDEAVKIVFGERQKNYGTPFDNHSRTAAFWSTYLGIELSAEQVTMMNILQKISREMNGHHRDNITDTIGYSINYMLCLEERVKRDKEEREMND